MLVIFAMILTRDTCYVSKIYKNANSFWQRKKYVPFSREFLLLSSFALSYKLRMQSESKIQVCDQTRNQKHPLVSNSSWSGERWERIICVSKGFGVLKKVLKKVQEFWPNWIIVNL